MNSFKLWLAQGFGAGRIPVAPGTFGSVVGLVWFGILLCLPSPILYLLGTVLGIPLSIWICGEGENILKQKDPGSIVLDEIIALPICFLSWLMIVYFEKGFWPPISYFLTSPRWTMVVVVFILFRFFDVVKPWPVRQSQSFSGGLGVTVDDVIAGVYVSLVVLVIWFVRPDWF